MFISNNEMMKTNPSTIPNVSHQPTSSPLPSSPPPPSKHRRTRAPSRYSSHPLHRTIASAANLANLLPTGTVLAFQTLNPSFSNQGSCQLANKFLTSSLIAFCSIICFLSSFTDSFVDSDGKLYYGIATFNGLLVFNGYANRDTCKDDEEILENNGTSIDLGKFRISFIDFVHAFVSLLVFLVFAFCDNDVQSCYFPMGGMNLDVLVVNLPMAAGVFSSFLFMIFPTTRRGIGCADMPTNFTWS